MVAMRTWRSGLGLAGALGLGACGDRAAEAPDTAGGVDTAESAADVGQPGLEDAETAEPEGDMASASEQSGLADSISDAGLRDTAETEGPADVGAEVSVALRPLLLAFTYHLEGVQLVQTRDAFDRYVAGLREVSDLFHRYGAIPTWDAAEIVKRSIDFEVNILKELEDRGDCIGLHANGVGFVPSDPDYTFIEMVTELTRQAEQIRSLGVTVRHVSNICSAVDWVRAVREADFDAATAMVDYCLKSLSDPGPGAACDSPASCHDAWPGTVEGQMTPWHAESGANWTTSVATGLLLVPSSGSVTCASEAAAGAESPTHCEYDAADADAVLAEVAATVAARKPGLQHTMVLVASWGKNPDRTVMTSILSEIERRWGATGEVRWVGFADLIDAVEGH
jgi:hypothetical protein